MLQEKWPQLFFNYLFLYFYIFSCIFMFLENIFPVFPVFSASNVVRTSVNDWLNMQVEPEH